MDMPRCAKFPLVDLLCPCQKATTNQLWDKWEKDVEARGERLPEYASWQEVLQV